MKAMVLAAGLGTRLRPLTDHTPKPLIDVAGRPMIAYPLLQLAAAGIRDVVVNIHHLASQMRAALGDGSAFGVHITYSEEEELLDTGGGIQRASKWLAGDTFLVLNADSIHDVPLHDVLRVHRERHATATLVLRPDPDAVRYGLIEVDDSDRVRRFLGEPRDCHTSLTPLMFAGVSAYAPHVLSAMQPGRFSLTRDTIAQLMRAGAHVAALRYDGYWRALDTPASLALGRREIEGGQPFSYLVPNTRG